MSTWKRVRREIEAFMNKGPRLLLLLFVPAALAAIAASLLVRRNREVEPAYQGRSLSLWLEDLDRWNRDTNAVVFAAIRAMGSNAVPELVRISLTPSGSPMGRLIAEKMRAYPKLKRLTPEDARILWARANMALGILGPDARAGLVPLLRQLQAEDPVMRARAMSALGHIGPVAEECLPTILTHTNDSEASMRGNVMLVLGMIGRQPEVCLPALTNGLGDPDPIVRANANIAISFFGGFDFAKPARQYNPNPEAIPSPDK
jgi:hypothetical protein